MLTFEFLAEDGQKLGSFYDTTTTSARHSSRSV
jgi:hypothetical protein